MPHIFKPGDNALFAYEEELLKGIVQYAYNDEITILFDGISTPSFVQSVQLQYVQTDF